MKLIHIADLHFGKTLHGLSLVDEGDQPHWCSQFIELVRQEKPDAVMIAGDVYDRISPSTKAVQLLSDFLTTLADMDVPVLMIAGNHDSGEKLSFLSSLLQSRKLFIAGTINEGLRSVTLHDEYGPVTFWLMPYVFPAAVAAALDDPSIHDYDTAVRKLLASADIDCTKRNVVISHQNVLANGTQAIRGGSESMVGGSGEVDYTAYDGVDYVALGHIHAAQRMGRDTVRYAGSPLCYHFSETRRSNKGPVIVELGEKGAPIRIRTEVLEPLHPLREIIGCLSQILEDESRNCRRGEYIRVVLTDNPIPVDAHSQLNLLFASKGSRLLEMSREIKGHSQAEADGTMLAEEKTVEELFYDFYENRSGKMPDSQQIELIQLIVQQTQRSDPERMEEDLEQIIKLLMKQEESK